MADRYLLESGTPDGYLLEDSSGVLLLEEQVSQPSPRIRQIITATILATWAITAVPVFASVGVQNGPLPPPSRSAVTQQIIWATWNPVEVEVPRRFVPQASAAPVEETVRAHRLPDAILTSWLPVEQDVPRRFVPQSLAVADNPTPYVRLPASILSSWELSQGPALWSTTGYQTGIDPTPLADNPPPRRALYQDILQSWEPPAPKAVQFTRSIALPDAPPQRKDWPTLGIILDAWLPVEPVVQRRFTPQPAPVTPDAPPLRRGPSTSLIILDSWLPVEPVVQRRFTPQPTPVTPDAPPLRRGPSTSLIILDSWLPVEPPVQGRRFVQPVIPLDTMAMERAQFRRVFGRLFGRVN